MAMVMIINKNKDADGGILEEYMRLLIMVCRIMTERIRMLWSAFWTRKTWSIIVVLFQFSFILTFQVFKLPIIILNK